VLLEWSHTSASTRKARLESKQTADGLDDLSDEDDQMEDDDLYSSAPGPIQVDNRMGTDSSTPEFYNFRLNDKLSSIGPLRDITLGKAFSNTNRKSQATTGTVAAELELVASQGSDRGGGLVVIKREIDPLTTMSLKVDDADAVWSASVTKRRGASSTDNPSCQYVVISRSTDSEQEVNEVFIVEEQSLKPFKAPEFNPNEDCTVDIGSLAGNTRLVQVLRNEVRSYDIGAFYSSVLESITCANVEPLQTSDCHKSIPFGMKTPVMNAWLRAQAL
jgi:cleavage and polyadenylation specificity factor subunit 1